MGGDGCLFVEDVDVDVVVVGCCGAEDDGSDEGGCWRKAAKKLDRKGRWGDILAVSEAAKI